MKGLHETVEMSLNAVSKRVRNEDDSIEMYERI